VNSRENKKTVRILIVDDNPESAYLAQQTLLRPDRDIRLADNGQAALDLLSSFSPQLVITDILLPIMDGFHLIRKMKEDPALKNIPVLIYTATFTGNDDRLFALSIGAEDFLVKPTEPEILQQKTEDLLAGKLKKDSSRQAGGIDENALEAYSRRMANVLRSKDLLVREESSARQLAESLLQDREQRLIFAQRIARMGDFVWNILTDRVTWSEPMYELLGYEKNEAMDLEKINMQIHHPDDLPLIEKWLQDCVHLSDGSCSTQEYRVRTKMGEVLNVQVTVYVRRVDNVPVEVIGTVQDITERKLQEKRLKETEQHYRTLADSGRAMIWTADLDNRPNYYNQPMLDILGIESGEEALPDWTDFIHPDDKVKIRKLMEDNMKRRLKFSENFRLRSSTANYHFIQMDASPMYDSGGKYQGFIGQALDISRRKNLEEQLFHAQKLDSVGKLAGGVAHDFNNILQIILGNTEILKHIIDEDKEKNDLIDEIYTSARKATDLTRQLLAFARKQSIQPRILDLNETIESMLKILRRLLGENITLDWKPGFDLWKVYLDPSQVDQVLANLCVNARDAISDVGRVLIETGSTSIDESYCSDHTDVKPGDYLVLTVSDNGCGMDEEILQQIFDPFFTTKAKGRGTGLGLSTVYGITRQNGGFIHVYSEMNIGSTFRIYFPRFIQENNGNKERTAVQEIIPSASGETVLIVEDEKSVLSLAERILTRLNYTVLTAESPHLALRIAEDLSQPIDLLISDVIMPEMSGRETADRIRLIRPDIKCLYISGYTSDIIADKGVFRKDSYFLQKPFTTIEISKKVREVLDEKKT